MNNEKKIMELNLGDILPNRFQPRIKFSEDSINELSESIKEHGVIQPIVVRKIGDKYEIIAGERRYKASVLAGKTVIPAILNDLNDKDSAEVALIENVQRQDLTPIEEAISYKKILDMGYTQEQLANKLGNKQSTIANKLRLLNLNEEVQEALLDGKISERHARSVLRLSDPKQQLDMLNNIITKRLTVRKADEEIDKILNEETVNNQENDEEIELLDTNAFSNAIVKNSNISKGVGTMVEEQGNVDNSIVPEQPKIDNSVIEIFNVEPADSMKMPSQPIIEEVEEANIPAIPISQPEVPVLNPGFMDIDKIEHEAKDIFAEKPRADVSSLLEPDPSAPVTTPSEEVEEEEVPENLLTPGKFFDILNEEPEEEKTEKLEEFSFENFEPIIQPEKKKEPKLEFEPFILPKAEQPVNIEPKLEGINSILNLKPVDENINNSVSEVKIEEKPMIQPLPSISVNKPQSHDLKTVIDMVRECSKKIEEIGYYIELEEIDFEDIYQVIFKINK